MGRGQDRNEEGIFCQTMNGCRFFDPVIPALEVEGDVIHVRTIWSLKEGFGSPSTFQVKSPGSGGPGAQDHLLRAPPRMGAPSGQAEGAL